METADASCEQIISKLEINENTAQIERISIEQLDLIERDLDFGEKVSVLFLLSGHEPIRSKVILQQFITGSFSKSALTNHLIAWARENSHRQWKSILLESLCIIQAKCVIRKLGIHWNDLEQRFLSSNPQLSLFIHPIVKLLYSICENLTKDESLKLVEFISKKYPSKIPLDFIHNGELLELYLLHWMWEGIIDIGDCSAFMADTGDASAVTTEPRQSLPCNLEPIAEFLKQEGFDTIKQTVKDVTHRFNCRMWGSRRSETGGDLNCQQTVQVTETVVIRPRNKTDEKQSISDKVINVSFDEKATVIDTMNTYRLRKTTAGILLVINQKEFYQEEHPDLVSYLPQRRLETRDGTEMDQLILEKTFSLFGYRVKVENNLTHTEILNAVRNVVNECVLLDSVIVCILSHGYKGVVYGSNSIPVKIEDIEKIMLSDRLIGKPKILIVQACQGDETQRAKEIGYLREDGPSMSSLPVYSDLLSCISTVPGFTSIRHTEKGSWFIQTLCKVLNERAENKHFIDILTEVCREVLNKRGRNNQCMVPIYHSTLRMDLYLPLK